MQQSLDAKFVKQPYNIASKHLYDKVHYKMMGLEMINKRTRNVAICYFLILLIAVITFAAFYPGDQQNVYVRNYIVDGILGIVSLIIYGVSSIKKHYILFSPITVISMLYITLFFFTPMYDIVLCEYRWFGVDLFDYGIKGSVIAFVGYIAFVAAYNIPLKNKKKSFFGDPKKTQCI